MDFFPFTAEILDFGYPQNSETGALKTFITQQGIKSQVRAESLTASGSMCRGLFKCDLGHVNAAQ